MPNGLARQLRAQRTDTIALVVTDIRNPFFTTIAGGVEDTARSRGYAVMFCNTYESAEEEAAYIRVLIERRVDGVLLVPAGGAGNSVRMLQAHGMPTVVLDRHLDDVEADEVRGDSRAGAYAVVRHLTELGHRDIAILTGPEGVSTSIDRVAGYREALLEVCPTEQCGRIIFGEFNEAVALALEHPEKLIPLAENLNARYLVVDFKVPAGWSKRLQGDRRPTAIFAANNFIAYGAMRALHEFGLGIPEDISVAVFDDLPPGWVMDPFFTVVSQPAYEIGTEAATLLLERLTGEAPGEPRSIILPSEVIVRRSTAAPRPH